LLGRFLPVRSARSFFMRLHRFFTDEKINLDSEFSLSDERLLSQWNKVLRLRVGSQVIMFNNGQDEISCVVTELNKKSARLKPLFRQELLLPTVDVYIFWSIIKGEKNDFILQKCTELGVNHFVPVLSERSEKKDINIERSSRILVEASEQCGRSSLPKIYQPINLADALEQYVGKMELFVAEKNNDKQQALSSGRVGVFIGPEGGWTDAEKQMFKKRNTKQINLGEFTLRAETAAIVAASKLLQ
jgi:16S rRNA (uracil1498-N3)-methyltransferase